MCCQNHTGKTGSFIIGTEPVRLSPGWEGTGRPDDELNFKGVTMDQADLELNPPKDRYVYKYNFTLLI